MNISDLPQASQDELNAFGVHLRDHRGATTAGCPFCYGRNYARERLGHAPLPAAVSPTRSETSDAE